jgi:large subunit ribosomal protein L1
MAELEEQLKEALENLRKNSKERKFKQSVDLVVNLQKFSVKKNNINTFVTLPNKIKNKKIAGFFEIKNKNIETITPEEFSKYKDKKKLKNLAKKYDFFVAEAKVMPKVASTFGRVLGPAGKMPSPQLGIIPNVNDKEIQELVNKLNNSVRIRTKEASIKLIIGKEDSKDKELIENIMTLYNKLINELPKQKENIKNIEIKFTMSKPEKIKV